MIERERKIIATPEVKKYRRFRIFGLAHIEFIMYCMHAILELKMNRFYFVVYLCLV